MGHHNNMLSSLPPVSAPQELADTIIVRVRELEDRKLKRRLTGFGSLSVASFLSLIFLVQYASADFAQSGFFDYFSLLFSDTATFFASWREALLSLVEATPLFSVTLLLCALFILLVSVGSVVRDNASVYQRVA